MRKLLAFLEVHSETDAEKKRLDRWKHQNADVLDFVAHRQFDLWKDADVEDADEDIVPQEFLETVTRLSRDEYEVVEMIQETFLDLDQIVSFLEEAKKFEPRHDDKLKKLIRLLKSKDLEAEKVLIFTEFADTARAICSSNSPRPGSRELRRLIAQLRAIVPKSFSASRLTTTERTQQRSGSKARRRFVFSSPPMCCPKD
jgi:ERCC4-related helicase